MKHLKLIKKMVNSKFTQKSVYSYRFLAVVIIIINMCISNVLFAQVTTTGTITVNTLPIAAITSSTNPTACGASDGFATAGGGTSYTWNTIPPQFTATATGLTSGTYTVTVSDGICSSSTSITLTDPSAPTVTLNADNTTICAGSSVTFTAGGATDYEFFVNGASQGAPSTVNVFTTSLLLNGDIINVNGTTSGCTGTSSNITLVVNDLPPVNAGVDQQVCAGTAVTLSGSGATSYIWDNGVTNGTPFTPLSTTTYTVTGTDGNGCQNTDQIIVTVNALPTVDAGVEQTVCNGTAVTLSGTGNATSYTWDNGVSNGTPFTPLSTTTYSVTGTDANGCTNTDNVLVTVNALPPVNAGVDQQVCSGTAVTLSGSGATSFIWDNGVSNGTPFTPLATTTYTVTGTDANGCTNTDNVLVTVNASPTAIITSFTNPTVCGASDGSATADGGTSYTWNTVPPQNTATATGLISGTYTVTVSDGTCSSSTSVTLTDPGAPAVTLSSNDTNICAGSSVTFTAGGATDYEFFVNGASQGVPSSVNVFTTSSLLNGDVVNVNGTISGCTGSSSTIILVVNALPNVNLGSDVTQCGGTVNLDATNAGSTYLWTGGSATQTLLVSATGIYSVTVTNTNGCTGTDTIDVTINASPTVNLGSDVTQCGGTVNLDAANTGSTYLWAGGSAAQTLLVSATGLYAVTVTNTNGCIGIDTISVAINALPTVNLGSDIMQCGIATLDAGNAGSIYLWTGGSVAQTLIVSATGIYSVTVTNTNGCTGTDTIDVTINASPTVNLGSDVTQCGGTVNLDAANTGSTYLWAGGSAAQTLLVSATGLYAVTVTNTNGCIGIDTISVAINALPTVNLGSDIMQCGIATLDAGNAGSIYLWTGGSVAQTLIASATGTYSVTVTNTNGCTGTDTIDVTINASPTVNLGPDVTQCGGTVTLDAANAGSTYLWTGGSATQTLLVSATGLYAVIVTNANGCTGTDTIDVTINASPTVNLGPDVSQCGSVILDAANAGSTYLWTGSSAAQTLLVSATGIYSVTVTNTNGCTATDTVNVTIHALPTVNAGPNQTVCNGTAVTLSGTGNAISYTWDNSVIDGTPFTPAVGSVTYVVTGTSANGCLNTDTVVVAVYALLTIYAGATQTVCAGGSATLTASGASTYTWDNGVTNGILFTPLATTIYTVTGTDANGCTNTDNITVTVIPIPLANAGNDTTINFGTDALLAGIATGGSGSYTWSWSPVDYLTNPAISNPIANPSITTIYTLVVSDNGCISTDSVVISVNEECEVFVPSGFSPNGDGKNDILYVYGNCIKTMEIRIFNRWGNKVYESTDHSKGWDGKYHGKAADTDVFVYYLRAETVTGKKIDTKGNITLMK